MGKGRGTEGGEGRHSLALHIAESIYATPLLQHRVQLGLNLALRVTTCSMLWRRAIKTDQNDRQSRVHTDVAQFSRPTVFSRKPCIMRNFRFLHSQLLFIFSFFANSRV